MNTIYDGSYTLGSTSALSFEAGPGIKIDEPSAGTVRIGTDETVLYENWAQTDQSAGTIFNLSESWKNFERIGITYDNMEFTGRIGYMEYPTSGELVFRPPLTNFNDGLSINIPYARWQPTGDNIHVASRGLLYDTWTSPKVASGSLRGYRLHKIVGINRIGGNE